MPVLRFQKQASITSGLLSNLLPAGALNSISSPEPGELIDIDVTAPAVTDCTEVMAARGYALVATDPVPTLESAAAAEVPPVTRILETGGATLTLGAVANGQVLTRSGTDLVGSAAGGDIRDNTLFDHFISGNIDSDEIGSAGWRASISGAGSLISATAEVGHPGVIDLNAAQSANGRCAIHLGDSAALGNWSIAGSQNPISIEWLFRVPVSSSVSSADVERITFGFGDEFESTTGGAEHLNGVYVEFDPSQTTAFRLRTAASGARSASNGVTAVVLATWYRVGIEITYPGGLPSCQMTVNGANEGAALTTNVPSIITGYGIRVDSAGGGLPAIGEVDYTLVQQVSNKET